MRAKRQGKRFLNPVPTSVAGLSVIFKIGPEFFFGAVARSPDHPLGPFRTDPRIYNVNPGSGLRVTWFGHSSSLIEIDGVRVLIDPVWAARASPTTWYGPKRFFPPCLPLEDLPSVDVILISHDHYDHLDATAIRSLARMESMRQAQWVTPLAVGKILRSLGVHPHQCTELDWTEDIEVNGLSITALPARHFSGRSPFNRFETLWASFVLLGKRHRVYYGADSGEWYGFREIGERFGPFDLTMLEIGAYNPHWADIHMGPAGAIRSFRALGNATGLLMPIHWGVFDLALHHWTQPIQYLFSAEDLKIWTPTPGTPSEVVSEEELRSGWWRG